VTLTDGQRSDRIVSVNCTGVPDGIYLKTFTLFIVLNRNLDHFSFCDKNEFILNRMLLHS